MLVCGDLFQLPPVNPPAVYCQISDILKDLSSLELWCKFKIAELTEVKFDWFTKKDKDWVY